MPTFPNAINVPKPEVGSFNPKRQAGLLLQSQALHMREALIKHLEELANLIAVDPKSLKTEADVSSYIHRATAILHRHAAAPSGE
jgi:hypothetical protein